MLKSPPREEQVILAAIAHTTRLVEESSEACTRMATAKRVLRDRLQQAERAIRKSETLPGVRDLDKLRSSIILAIAVLDADGDGIADRTSETADYDSLSLIERAAPTPDGGDALKSWHSTFAAANAYESRIEELGRLEEELAARRSGPGERRAYVVLAGYHGRWEDGVNKTFGPGAEMMLNAWELASIGAHRVVAAEAVEAEG